MQQPDIHGQRDACLCSQFANGAADGVGGVLVELLEGEPLFLLGDLGDIGFDAHLTLLVCAART
ncbi:MAG: hypothetical protein QM702_11165 [Rubrivivax sp.]